jgi:hypothetical protein
MCSPRIVSSTTCLDWQHSESSPAAPHSPISFCNTTLFVRRIVPPLIMAPLSPLRAMVVLMRIAVPPLMKPPKPNAMLSTRVLSVRSRVPRTVEILSWLAELLRAAPESPPLWANVVLVMVAVEDAPADARATSRVPDEQGMGDVHGAAYVVIEAAAEW